MPLKLSEIDQSKVEVIGDKKPLRLSELDDSANVRFLPEASAITAGLAGASQGLTAGYSDEAIGALLGARDYLSGQLGLRGEIPFSEAYKTQRDAYRRGQKRLQEDSPKAYKTAEIAGGLAPAFLSGGAAAPVTAAKVAGGGALAGLGYSEGDLGSAQSVLDTALGAGVSLATLGAIKGGGKVLSAVKEKAKPHLEKASKQIAESLKDFAEERAAKAAISGGNLKTFKELSAKKGGVSGFGRAMLSEEYTEKVFKDGQVVSEIKRPILTAGAKAETYRRELRKN